MLNPTLILALAAVLGPLAAWQLTALKASWIDIPAAVAAARSEARTQCDGRITAIQTELNNKVLEMQQRAETAERSMAPTPAEAAELQDLCNRSASCRSRKRETSK